MEEAGLRSRGAAADGAARTVVDRIVAPLARRGIERALKGWQVGRLTIHLPDGSMLVAGRPAAEPHAVLWIERDAFFTKFALRGDLGAGESYVDGDWRTDSLARFAELVLRNQACIPFASPLTRLGTLADDWHHRRRRNSRTGSRRNVEAHYDLSNELFETFLDQSMAYSSAVFDSDADGLEAAQCRKFERWCERLRLCADDHLLEIGSGWGGFALHAARTRGCRVTGITVSPEQLAWSRARLAADRLDDRVTFRLCDYRDVHGPFDKVISIEMIEAVGEDYWPHYFRKIDEVLAPGGLAGIQAIVIPDAQFDRYRQHCDWIQKYIFPGGLLPSVRQMTRVSAATTRLNVTELEDRRLDYARTLAAWRSRFFARLEHVRGLGFDERFIRMWEYYLATCEAGFRTENLGLAQIVMERR